MEEIEVYSQAKLKEQRRQESLATLGLYALKEGDLESIIHRAVQQLCLTLEVEYVLLLDWEKKENTLRIMANTGWELKENSKKEIKAEKEWDVGYALRAEKPVIVQNYAEEEFKLSPLLNDSAVTSALLLKVIESNEVCGILAIYSKKKREFTKHDLSFLQIVGNLIGMSSERIKSKKDLEETNKKLKKEIERSKKFQKQILNNSILERWDLGGFLHDDLGQRLVSIKMGVADIQHKLGNSEAAITSEIEEVLEQIDEGITSVRKLTQKIIPVNIKNKSVREAFEDLMDQMAKTHKINCTLTGDKVIEQIKDRKLATNLYHIVQEAVINAATHGEPQTIEVQIEQNGEFLELKIKDDGKGISNTEKEKDDIGCGFYLMKHRAELIGGSFHIEDGNDISGTQIVCSIPLELVTESNGLSKAEE